MSQQAPFVDAATSIDPTNEDNTFISYYTWGSVLGLALDLSLRKEFGKPLDGYMRMMWTKYGQSEVPYTLQDLQTTLVEYSGKQGVRGHVLRAVHPGARGARHGGAAGAGRAPPPAPQRRRRLARSGAARTSTRRAGGSTARPSSAHRSTRPASTGAT